MALEQAVTMIIPWILLAPIVIDGVIVKDVTLNANNPSVDGATVIALRDVTQNGDSWDVDVSDQTGYHLKLELDNTWGFHSTKESTIRIIIDGSSKWPTQGNELELMTTFMVYDPNQNTQQFFTIFLYMDENENNQIAPTCGGGDTNAYMEASDIEDEVNNPVGGETRVETAMWGEQGNIQPTNRNEDTNAFPREYILEHFPNSELTISIHNEQFTGFEQMCTFYEAFASNQGLTVFIAGSDDDEQFSISSIKVTYDYDTTPPPTREPSDSPTNTITTDSPTTATPTTSAPTTHAPTTAVPTSSEPTTARPTTATPTTATPTKDPTKAPSQDPTQTPTEDPTKSPQNDPTSAPSKDPTIDPTTDPTNDPTADPTGNPTIEPTTDPTSFPSRSPITDTSHPSEYCVNENSATLTVSFIYTLTNNSVSRSDVENTLSTTTDTFITNNIAESTNCQMTNYSINIGIMDTSQEAAINATLCFDCKNEDELEINYNEDELERDFIEIVDTNILSIVSNSTSFNVEVGVFHDGAVHDQPTTSTVNEESPDNGQDKSQLDIQAAITQNLLMVILGGVALILICCIIVLAIIYRKRSKRNMQHHDREIKKVTSVSMTGLTDVVTNAIHPRTNTSTPMTPNMTGFPTTSQYDGDGTRTRTSRKTTDIDDDMYDRGNPSSVSTVGGALSTPRLGSIIHTNGMNMSEDGDAMDGNIDMNTGPLPDEHVDNGQRNVINNIMSDSADDDDEMNDLYLETNVMTPNTPNAKILSPNTPNGMAVNDLGEGGLNINQYDEDDSEEDDFNALYGSEDNGTIR